jgi:hypothetical protein
MARARHREAQDKFSLWDSLRKQHLDYIEQERTFLQSTVGMALWHLRLSPYPFDEDIAAAVAGIIDHQVCPWGVVEKYIEGWAYAGLCASAVQAEMQSRDLSRIAGEAVVPELETLRGVCEGWIPEQLVGEWAVEFADECEDLGSIIREGLCPEVPSLVGRFIRMPYLPLGHDWLSRVPLLDHVWIDRTIVALCETSALLEREEGYTRLPPRDPHTTAWHRFFPPGTRWAPATATPHTGFHARLSQVTAVVRAMPARDRCVAGRRYVHIDDYAAWGGRRVPLYLLDAAHREQGLAIGPWNDWVRDNADDGRVDLFGTPVGTIPHPWGLRTGERIHVSPSPDAAEAALGERTRALDQLYLAGLKLSVGRADGPDLSQRQQNFLEALQPGPLHAGNLAKQAGYHRRTLFKPRGITELCQLDLVVNDPGAGGYRLTPAGTEYLARHAHGV